MVAHLFADRLDQIQHHGAHRLQMRQVAGQGDPGGQAARAAGREGVEHRIDQFERGPRFGGKPGWDAFNADVDAGIAAGRYDSRDMPVVIAALRGWLTSNQ